MPNYDWRKPGRPDKAGAQPDRPAPPAPVPGEVLGAAGAAAGNRPGAAAPVGKADWRRRAAAGAAAAGDKRGGTWRVNPDQAYQEARRWYRLKLASWVLVIAVLLSLFVWYLIPNPHRTSLLAVAITDYGSSQETRSSAVIPPNGWAVEDLQRLQSLDKPEEIVRYQAVNYSGWEAGQLAFQDLASALKDSKLTGGPQRPVIVYLSVHGVVNAEGQPCLLLPGAPIYDSRQWLRLRDLLLYLFPKDASPGLPRHTLLILDCNRIECDWRLGQLYNGFADRLEEVVNEVNIPGLAILNSTSPGQAGWTSPEQLHGSVFGYFVWQGLRGAADLREEKGNGNGEVSLQELYHYVRAHVRQWVLENRSEAQEPMLVPRDAEIARLVHAKPTAVTSLPPVEAAADRRWEQAAGLWKRHAALQTAATLRNDPLHWEEFQQKLLRLDQLALGGGAYRDQFDSTRRRLEILADSFAADDLGSRLHVFCLPLAQHLAGPQALAGPRAQLKATWNAKTQTFDLPPDKVFPFPAIAAEVWDRALQGLGPERWPALLDLVDRAAGDRRAGFVETHFLHMLTEHLDAPVLAARADLVQTALAVRAMAEQAAAPADERTHYWAPPLVNQADEKRRQAEDDLFVGDGAALLEAAARFREAGTAPDRPGLYADALQRLQQLADALAARDEAWAKAPHLAAWIFSPLHAPAPAQAEQLHALVLATQELAAQLDQALPAQTVTPALIGLAQEVRQRLDQLLTAFQGECSGLWERAGADRQTFRGIECVLSGPLVTGDARNRLRSKYLQILSSGVAAAEAEKQLVGLAEGQTSVAHYVLRLTKADLSLAGEIVSRTRLGVTDRPPERPPAEELSPEPAAADGASAAQPAATAAATADRRPIMDRVNAAAKAGERLRFSLKSIFAQADKWGEETSVTLAANHDAPPAESRAGRCKADRLVRAAAPLLDMDLNPWTDPLLDPPHQLRRLDLHFLFLWHCRRTLEDFWGPAARSPDTPFFQAAAEGYLDSARELCQSDKGLRCQKVELPLELQERVTAAATLIQPRPQDLMVDTEDKFTRGRINVSQAEQLPPGKAALFVRDPQEAPGRRTLDLLGDARLDAPPHRRLALAVDGRATAGEASYFVATDEPRLAHHNLEAVALYRGHVVKSPFVAETVKSGVTVVYQPPPYQAPVITVNGNAAQGCPIEFILDYSGSMTEMVPLLNERSEPVNTPRYIVARNALLSVLPRLVTPDNRYEVGLRVYGHRVGWDPAGGRTLVVWDPANPSRTIPRPPGSNFSLSNDIEAVFPLGKFRPGDPAVIQQILQPLQPLGETPLYAAIEQAIGDLNGFQSMSGRDRGRPVQRHIVAITDGVDETFDDEGHWLPSDTLRLEQAFRAPGNEDIRLDVLGFNLNSTAFQEQVNSVSDPVQRQSYLDQLFKRFNDLKQLAAETGDAVHGRGAFYDVTDPASLVRAVERSLELRQFTIENARDKRPVTPRPVDLNRSVTVNQPPGLRLPYTVRVTDPQRAVEAGVVLQGGEALELFLSDDARRLEHRRYQRDLRGGQTVADPADPHDPARRCFVGLHLPSWADNETAARFYLSVQNADAAQFSPPPQEAWIRVRPVSEARVAQGAGAEAPSAYPFSELELVPDRPVPVLTCQALRWPAAAQRAEVQLWFKFTSTPPDTTITVGDFKRRGGRIELPELPGRAFDLDVKPGGDSGGPSIAITERRTAGKSFDPVKVSVDPAPLKIMHHYSEDVGTVRHTFIFETSTAAALDGLSIGFTSWSKLCQRAYTLSEPFTVDLPAHGVLQR